MFSVELKNLKKGYNSKKIFENLSLSIEEGSFSSIIGPSGIGKSTLLKIIAGMQSPDGGTVTVLDKNITLMSDKENDKFRLNNIGFIFQEIYLVPYFNVFDNIILPAKLYNGYPKDLLDDLISVLNIGDILKSDIYNISGGEKQRVGIARALLLQPKILLADEPSSNLDKKNTFDIVGYIQNASKLYNLTTIVATHDDTILSFADKVYDFCNYSEWV